MDKKTFWSFIKFTSLLWFLSFQLLIPFTLFASFSENSTQEDFMKTTERFSNRVENYVLFRPHYPKEIISFFKEKIGLTKDWIIADIGSGTGISSELFIENGNTVYGVEPNQEMRSAAEAFFKNDKYFISVNAIAEATFLPDCGVDIIVAGQAFHWFDQIETKKEFQRIAHSNTCLVLMWNDRDMGSDFQKAYEQMLKDFSVDYEKVSCRHIDENRMKEFFSPNSYSLECFHHSQFFDFESLKGRLLSTSYAPLEDHPYYFPMMQRLRKIFDEYSIDSKVEFEYNCCLYYGKCIKGLACDL